MELQELRRLSGICFRDAPGVSSVTLTLRSGHRLTGTPDGSLLVADDSGPEWRALARVEKGDFVAIRYGGYPWPSETPRFLPFSPPPRYGSQKLARWPRTLDESVALFLGMYVAEGCWTRSNWTVSITNADSRVIELSAHLIQEHFGVKPFVEDRGDRCPSTRVASKVVCRWLEHVGVGRTSYKKRIPPVVFEAPESTVLAFLRGLALDAYTTMSGTSAKWAICVASRSLLDDLQVLLTRLGYLHGRIRKRDPSTGRQYDEVYVSGPHAQNLIERAPFLEAEKARAAAPLLDLNIAPSSMDVVPGLDGRALSELIPRGRSGRNGYGHRSRFSHLRDPRSRHVSRATLERLASVPGLELPGWAKVVLEAGLHFSPVAQIG